VSRELKDRENMNQLDLSLQHLLWYADEGEDTLNSIVTGDESRVHHYQPDSKHASMQWCKRFSDDEEVETEVRKWLRQQSKDFCAAGFDALVKRWDKCIDAGGGYIEK
jgi:hypothetical protein